MIQVKTNKDRRRAGFTLVELLVAAALLILVFGSVALVGGTSQRAYRTGTVVSHLESQVAITMERIVSDLRTAGVDTLAPDPIQGVGGRDVQYVQATGMQGGVVQWSPLRQLAFEYEPDELDDGIDNNGNELIDEGRVVLIEDLGGPQEHRRVLTRWVPELAEGELENGVGRQRERPGGRSRLLRGAAGGDAGDSPDGAATHRGGPPGDPDRKDVRQAQESSGTGGGVTCRF